jgi:hypothetical protein
VTGTDPGSRGAEIGSRFGEGIRDAVDGYLEFFGIRGLPEDRVRGIAESCFATLEAWAPNLAAELAATAEAAGVPLWRLAAGIIGGAAASFFLTTDFWSGAVAEAMGYIDLSAPVAMIVSGGLYYLFTRRGYTFGDTR